MRLIGNKTHGDLAEITITSLINQYMNEYSSKHVGKDLFRSKKHEEDIQITDKLTGDTFPVSLKAYGNGPFQLSTDKNQILFTYLKSLDKEEIKDKEEINEIFKISIFNNLNILSFIYNEKIKQCNILVFDFDKAKKETVMIKLVKNGKGRKHPVFRFYDKFNNSICEARYGDGESNPFQRGLWTNTKNSIDYFDSITNGWIEYNHNIDLLNLLSFIFITPDILHKELLKKITEYI